MKPLTDDQLDALKEVINIGVGKAAVSLESMTESAISLSVPELIVCQINEVDQFANNIRDDLLTSISQGFEGSLEGRALLSFPSRNAMQLAQIIGGEEIEQEEDLNFQIEEILAEVGNIVLNGVMGTIANLLQSKLVYTIPELDSESHLSNILKKYCPNVENSDITIILANTQFTIASENIDGSLLMTFQMRRLTTLIDILLASH